jgi:hypothetical protein
VGNSRRWKECGRKVVEVILFLRNGTDKYWISDLSILSPIYNENTEMKRKKKNKKDWRQRYTRFFQIDGHP